MKEIKALTEIIQKLNYVMTRKQKRECVGIFFLLIIGALLELIGISIVLPFIYAIMDMEKLMQNRYILYIKQYIPLESGESVLWGIIILIIAVYVIKNLILMFIQYCVGCFGCGFKKDVSTRMLSAYLHQPYIAYSQLNTADVLRGIYSDVEGSYNMLSTLLNMMADILGMVLICVYLFYTDSFFAIGLILLAAISAILLYKGVRSKTKEMGYRQREISAGTYKIACQAVGGIKDIMVMNRQKQFETAYEDMFEEKKKIEITYGCFVVLPTRIIETIFITGLVILVGIRYSIGMDNTEFIAKLAVFAMAAVKLMPYVSKTVANVTQLIYMRLNIISVYNHLRTTEKYRKELSQSIEKKEKFVNNVVLSNVVWKYPDNKKAILKGINLEIKKGESVAFIGESGAGKTTLADIILGLYVPQEGTVTVDGVSIYDIPHDWSKIVGYVPQSVYLLDDTIRNNILFGEKQVDDKKIWEALKQAQLYDFVKTLPEGLDTIVGERGIKFSGGQRQRIAIARALYYNPDILVLDEATSALDNETEEALMESIEALQGLKTLIIIAHRLSTIRSCDKIYEIKDGKAELRNKEEILKGI